MSDVPTRRITLHIAINEKGDYRLSNVGPQEALSDLVGTSGGAAFRVVDINLDILFASPVETRKRRADALRLRVVE